MSDLLKNTVELIAAVPSVIYGFWALSVLVPMIRSLEIKWQIAPYGVGGVGIPNDTLMVDFFSTVGAIFVGFHIP